MRSEKQTRTRSDVGGSRTALEGAIWRDRERRPALACEKPRRSTLVSAARRVLWSRLRERVPTQPLLRSALRRRLAEFLRRCAGVRLLGILRSAALAGTVAAALLTPASARAQAIELADVANGLGGFIVQGAHTGASVSGAGDVNGDGIPDLILGGRYCYNTCHLPYPTYVVFGKRNGAAVDLSDVQAGKGGFVIRGSAENDSGWSVSGAGDVNGDGLADLLIGAPGAAPEGRSYAGESYVVFGKRDGAALDWIY